MDEQKRNFGPKALWVSLATMVLVSGLFIVPTIMGYAKTPPDALKGIGYIVIVFYGMFVGLLGGLSVFFGSQAYQTQGNSTARLVWTLMSVLFAVLSVVLFLLRFRVT